MTRKEAERLTHQADTLRALGFTSEEAEQLRRISMTLHRWAEHECNGDIERDEDGEGKPYRSHAAWGGSHLAYRIADRERGALKRLQAIVNARNTRERATTVHTTCTLCQLDIEGDYIANSWRDRGNNWTCKGEGKQHHVPPTYDGDLTTYVQGDPRGCALYILRPGDVPEGQRADSYYTRGITVY